MPNAAGEATDVALGPVARISKFFAGVFSHRAAVDAAEDVFKKGAKASKADPKIGDVDGILNGTKSTKVEPTIGAAKPKAAEDAAGPTKKAHSGANQDDISEQLKQAKDTGKTAAEREAEAAAQKAAAEEAAAKAKAAGGAEDAAKAGATGTWEQGTIKKISARRARKIINDTGLAPDQKLSLYDKIIELHKGGKDDMIPLAIAKSRAEGAISKEAAFFTRNEAHIPEDIVKKVTDLKSNLAGRPLMAWLDRQKGKLDYIGQSIRYDIKHPTTGALRLTAISIKAPFMAIRHPIKTFYALAGATGLDFLGRSVLSPFESNPDSAYNRGKAAGTDVLSATGTVVKGYGSVLSTVLPYAPFIGAPLAGGVDWLMKNGGPTAMSALKTTSKGIDGAMDAAVPNSSSHHLPSIPGIGSVAKGLTLLHNVDNDEEETGAKKPTVSGAVATVKGLEGKAKAAVGGVIDKGEEAGGLGALLSGIDITDPDKSWKKMELAAKGNPMMEKIMQAADKNPLMKWGVILGFGAGILGGGKPGERLMAGIKNAIVIGLMMDLVGGLFGYHSILGDKFNSMLHGGSRAPAGNNDLGLNYHPGADGNAPGQTIGDTNALSAERLEAAKRYIALEDPDHKMFKSQAEIDAAVDKQAARFNAMPAAQFQQAEADMKNRVITSGVDQQPLPNATNAGVFQTVQDGSSRSSVARALDGTPQQDDTKESFNGGATRQATTAPLLSAGNPVAVSHPVYSYGGDNNPTYGSFDYGSDTGSNFGTGLTSKNVPVPMPSMG